MGSRVDGPFVGVIAALAGPYRIVHPGDDELRAADAQDVVGVVEQLDAGLRVGAPRREGTPVVFVVAHYREDAEPRIQGLHRPERRLEPGQVVTNVAGEHDEIGAMLARSLDDVGDA